MSSKIWILLLTIIFLLEIRSFSLISDYGHNKNYHRINFNRTVTPCPVSSISGCLTTEEFDNREKMMQFLISSGIRIPAYSYCKLNDVLSPVDINAAKLECDCDGYGGHGLKGGTTDVCVKGSSPFCICRLDYSTEDIKRRVCKTKEDFSLIKSEDQNFDKGGDNAESKVQVSNTDCGIFFMAAAGFSCELSDVKYNGCKLSKDEACAIDCRYIHCADAPPYGQCVEDGNNPKISLEYCFCYYKKDTQPSQ